MINNQEILSLLQKYRKDRITPSEFLRLKEIILDKDYEEKLLYFMDEHFLDINETVFFKKNSIDAEFRFSRLRRKIIKDRRNLKNSFKFFVAACIVGLVLVSVYFIQHQTPETIEMSLVTKCTGFGEKSRITLPDGTLIFLNAGSEISYPEKFSDSIRSVSLTGEAYFKVHRNEEKPFVVTTRNIDTRVLGTSFNINSYADNNRISVSVLSGKVVVSHLNAQKVEDQNHILVADDQIVYKNSIFERHHVDVKQLISWKNDVLIFDDTPLSEAIGTLNRWYDVNIKLADTDLGTQLITGRFKENEELSAVLEALEFSLDINYSIDAENKSITIDKNKTEDRLIHNQNTNK